MVLMLLLHPKSLNLFFAQFVRTEISKTLRLRPFHDELQYFQWVPVQENLGNMIPLDNDMLAAGQPGDLFCVKVGVLNAKHARDGDCIASEAIPKYWEGDLSRKPMGRGRVKYQFLLQRPEEQLESQNKLPAAKREISERALDSGPLAQRKSKPRKTQLPGTLERRHADLFTILETMEE
jgi:hypothetical protein